MPNTSAAVPPTPPRPRAPRPASPGARHPAAILAEFDAGCAGDPDVDLRGLLLEVIGDIVDSGVLFLTGPVASEVVADFQDTLDGYVSYYYGDT